MKIPLLRRPSLPCFAIISCGIILLLGNGTLSDQFTQPMMDAEPEWSADPIPQSGYKSWSLFLISSPEWLLGQSDEKLNALYKQFQTFGDAIGHKNAAVWFWSRRSRWSTDDQRTVDVPRSIEICKRLKLKPSEGPYVVVMTRYPGECILSDPDSFPRDATVPLKIKLNGNDAASITHLLGNLADRLLTEDLSKLQSNPEDYWNGWRHVFTKLSTLVIGLSSKVTVAFDTGPVKTEIKLGP